MRSATRRLSRLALVAFLGLVATGSSAFAAGDPPLAEPARKELTAPVAEALGQLRTLTEAKDHAAALALADRLAAGAAAGSFDAYVLAQIRAQVLLAQGRYDDALVSLESAFRLGEASPGFAEPAARLEQLNLLAQLHAQRAPDLKEPAARRAAYEAALAGIRRWQREAPRITAESRVFTGSVLFQLATLDAAKPDADFLQEAVLELEDALVLAPSASAQTLTLLAVVHLQRADNLRAAEWFELLVERDPKNGAAWSQLQAIYLTAAAGAEKSSEARRLNLRALHTLERAQAQGYLSTARDHYTSIALLFNLQQFGLAAEQLEKGLADAVLEDNRRNWELLASAYSQLGREERALDALDRAVRRLPADGALEFTFAQTLYQQGRVADAYARAEAAVGKPGLDKPGQAKVYLASLAFELQRYADADRWVAAARAGGDVPAATLDPLARAVTETLRDRQG